MPRSSHGEMETFKRRNCFISKYFFSLLFEEFPENPAVVAEQRHGHEDGHDEDQGQGHGRVAGYREK